MATTGKHDEGTGCYGREEKDERDKRDVKDERDDITERRNTTVIKLKNPPCCLTKYPGTSIRNNNSRTGV